MRKRQAEKLLERQQQAQSDPQIAALVRLTKKGPVSFEEVCNKLDISPSRARVLLERARDASIELHLEHDHIGLGLDHVGERVQSPKTTVKPALGRPQRVGVITDTHLGSKYCLRDQLRDFIEHAYQTGVREILHVGDILDGDYRHSKFEVSHVGLEDQTQDLFEVLPQMPGLTYHAITGNHDFTFTEKAGVSVGPYIEAYFRAQGRSDFASYGDRSAFLQIRGALIHLWHPKKGMGYALSYPLQKQVERYAPGEKPQILLVGHWHVSAHIYTRGVHAIACPCFQGGGSAFGKSLGGSPAIGGRILEWDLTEEGTMRQLRIEHVDYFEREALWNAGPEGDPGGIEVMVAPTRTGFARRVKIQPPSAERWSQ